MFFSPKLNLVINHQILLLVSILLSILRVTNQSYNISFLSNFSSTINYWSINEKYIYYINIQDYNITDENVLQILSNDKKVLDNLIVTEIDESLINNINNDNINKEDIIEIKDLKEKFTIKRRLTTKQFYYEIPFKKISEKQKNFVILVEPKLEYNKTEVFLYVSCPIPNYYIHKEDIDNGNIITKTFYMDNKIEKFFKFNLINISLEKANLIFYIYDKQVSSFYMNNISSIDTRAKIFIIEKNTTNELNHIIYVALIGEANYAKIQITLDYHDIKYHYGTGRDIVSFYIEKLNCKNDFYFFENYFNYESNYITHLYATPIYGDYELVYYDNILGTNLNEIFKPNNKIQITEYIERISTNFNILKLSCKKPTLIKLKYMKENETRDNITEGKEITTYMFHNEYKDIRIITDSSEKIYLLYFELFGKTKLYNTTDVVFFLGRFNKKYIHLANKNTLIRLNKSIDIYHEDSIEENIFGLQTYGKVYLKVYLISNLYYKNIIEGVTKINSETKAIAFKLRRDIIFDYFIVKIYSHNKSNLISLDYELKIVDPTDIDNNNNVMLAINKVPYYNQKEIILKFSNPYNKFNSSIKEGNFLYFLASLIIREDNVYPIYIDIRYYYNDNIVIVENSLSQILLNEKEYRIFGDRNYDYKNKTLINLNKCNLNKNYYIKSYYENDKNIIDEKYITEKRTILLKDNIYQNIKFKIYSNDSLNQSIYNNNSNSNSILRASYYQNGDLYMNYFSLNEQLYNSVQLTNDFTISYKDNRQKITFNWNNYIINKGDINNSQVNYSLYILPNDSPIKTICQMSLIPPNISLINENKYEIDLPKGNYKISIMASVINYEYPITTFYDILNFNVPIRINIALIIIIIVGILLLLITFIFILYCKKKSKKKKDIRLSRFSMISMAKILGNDDEEDEEILKKNILINNEKEDIINDNKEDKNEEE